MTQYIIITQFTFSRPQSMGKPGFYIDNHRSPIVAGRLSQNVPGSYLGFEKCLYGC